MCGPPPCLPPPLRCSLGRLFLRWLADASCPQPLVKPPRSRKGSPRKGLFSTRAPDRPNPIGLSAVELVSVRGLEIVVSGVDLLDGTPILDIKPVRCGFKAHPTSSAPTREGERTFA